MEHVVAVGRFEELLDHMEWANGRALRSVRESGDGEALDLMAHVLAAERVWLRRLESGEAHGVEIWPDLTARQCEVWMRENVRGYLRFLSGTSEEELREPVRYANSTGTEYRTPPAEILTHVALHGEHHRGQIARRIRRTGSEPANTDFITFVRERATGRS